jgi:hypothetical protein
MNRLIDLIKRNPSFIAYILFSVLILAAFVRTDQAREQSRVDSCISSLDNAIAIRDIIDMSGGRAPNLPPERQAVVDRIYERIELPPRICEGTSVDVQSYFRTGETTTTTTTTVEQVGLSSTVETIAPEGTAASESSRAPPTTGPVTPDRYDPPPTPSTTSTTAAPTTTTTLPPIPEDECSVEIAGVCFVDVDLPLFTGSGIFPFMLIGI